MTASSRLLLAALGYARLGWHIFPLRRDTKGQLPNGTSSHLLANGFKGASRDAQLVQSWWERWPDANIGLSLSASGLVAIDADLYKSECLWDEFIRSKHLPDTFVQTSPRGGRHYVFRTNPGDIFPGRLCHGVDIKFNGYILLAPSNFQGLPYCVADGRHPVPRPDWLPGQTANTDQPREWLPLSQAAVDDEVAELLSWIDPDGEGYDGWIEVLQGLHHHFGGSSHGLEIADAWSRRGGKYKPGEVSTKWSGFNANGGITLRTVAHYARRKRANLASIAQTRNSNSRTPVKPAANPKNTNNSKATLDLSQDELALELGRTSFDRDAKFVASQEGWYFWSGNRWRQDTRLEYLTRTREFLRAKAQELLPADGPAASGATRRRIDQLKSNASVSAVANLARANPASIADADDFDRDHFLLGAPDGTIDLRTGKIRTARRSDLISRLTTFSPSSPGEGPQRWVQFLDEIMAGDTEIIAFLQRAAGYALTGSTREHKLLFLHGSGRNGKSVFLNTLLNIWGDYGRRVAASTFLASQTERHPTDIASLRGARLAIASELPRGKTWDEAVIKDLTGGDRMTARFMRQNFFEFDPQLTLMIAGNIQPSFRGVDAAIRSRVVLVPFTVTIPPERQDKLLETTLRSEGPQILRWCIDGALDWQRRGLDVPGILTKASQDYFDEEDIIGQFLGDETCDDASGFVSGQSIAQRFNGWADLQGLSRWTQRSIIKELKTRGYMDGRTSSGRGIRGLRFK